MEKLQLVMQLENVRRENKELVKQIESVQSHTLVYENGKQDSLDEDRALESSNDPLGGKSLEELEEKSDAMEIPRLRRRLAQTENELKRTRTKLLSAQSTLKASFGTKDTNYQSCPEVSMSPPPQMIMHQRRKGRGRKGEGRGEKRGGGGGGEGAGDRKGEEGREGGEGEGKRVLQPPSPFPLFLSLSSSHTVYSV